jgi:hydrogenase maturation factor
MTVVDVDHERDLALCSDAAGRRSSVEIALVDPVMTGELLLVHAGTALGRVGEDATPGASEIGRRGATA